MAGQLLKDFEPDITSITLLPSDGGKFEVVAGDQLIYSKLQTRRHAEYDEIRDAVRQRLPR